MSRRLHYKSNSTAAAQKGRTTLLADLSETNKPVLDPFWAPFAGKNSGCSFSNLYCRIPGSRGSWRPILGMSARSASVYLFEDAKRLSMLSKVLMCVLQTLFLLKTAGSGAPRGRSGEGRKGWAGMYRV